MVLEALNILQGLDLKAMRHNSAAYIHAVTEALKLAAADREVYFGDPDFVDVPLDALLSRDYAARRRAQIDPTKAWPGMPPAGEVGGVSIPPWRPDPSAGAPLELADAKPETSFLCVADKHGNVFAATPSDPTICGPVVPGTGITVSMWGSRGYTGAGSSCAHRSGTASAHVGQSGDRDQAGRDGDAVRFARQRSAGPGDGAGVPQPGGVRHGSAIGVRGAAVRQLFLAGIYVAAFLSSRGICASRKTSARRHVRGTGRVGPSRRVVAGAKVCSPVRSALSSPICGPASNRRAPIRDVLPTLWDGSSGTNSHRKRRLT